MALLAQRIEDRIERDFGFRPSVIVRTAAALKDAIARNPFAARSGIEPAKLAVAFLSTEPAPEALAKVLAINAGPEEVRGGGRELYIYFPNGMGRSKLSMPLIERTLKTPVTCRNWNTVAKLLEIAETLVRG